MSGAKDWAKLNIATLKLELADRNLDVTGKKVDLVTRLEQYECASKQNLASGDGPGLSEDSKHHDSHDTTGEVFSVDDLQLVDEFIDEDYLEEEEKMEGLDKENRDDGKPEQLKTYDVATLYIPKVNEMHKDLQVAQKFRVLYIYPLRTEMMADPAIQIHFLRCSSVLCKFYPTETPDGYISEGYVILRFEFSEDALTAMEELTNILPANVHIKVRQLGQTHMDVLSGIIRTEPKGVEIWLKDNKNTKIVFVGNLPPTATEAALKEIFTGATIIRIAREDDSSSKGYAIVGYDNSKDAEQAAEEHSSAVLDSYVLAVFHFPATPKRPAAEKEQMERLKKTEKDEKQESVKSEEPVKKESVTPQMKKGVTPLKKSGVTPQKQENTESKITPGQIKRESSTPQRNATPGLKKPVTPQEGVPKKDSVTPKVKKESPTPQAKKNGQDTKKTGAKPTGKVNNKSPAAASQKTGGVRTAEKHQAVGAGRQGPRQTQRLAQKRPRARGGNKPGFPQQQRRVGGKWEQTNDNKGMRGNQTQLLRSPYQRMQKKQGLWEQALERRQEQRTGGGMQRQSTWRSQQFANGNKRQLPYNSGGVDDKRRRMEQTPYGSRQSSYEPRAPSLLDMSITKRMAQQMSPNSGFLHGGAGLGQGGGMGGGMGMGQGVGMVQGGGFEQGGGMGMGGGMMEQGGGMVQDRGMMMQDRGMVQDRGMMLQDRGMMLQDQGMMVQDRGVVQDRGMMVQERGMAQDRGMVQGGGIYPGSSMQQGQMGYGGGNQARMQSDIMGAGGGMGPGEMGQGSGGPGQGSGVAPSSGTVNLLLGLTQILSNQLPPQSRQMMRQSRGQSRGGQSYSRGGNRGGSTNRGGGTRRFRGFNGSRR